jgi:hypothetical protein
MVIQHHFVIAKVDLNVDIEPRLGQYDWIDFLKAATDYERRETSKIFEYHFIKYGDPSDKREFFFFRTVLAS